MRLASTLCQTEGEGCFLAAKPRRPGVQRGPAGCECFSGYVSLWTATSGTFIVSDTARKALSSLDLRNLGPSDIVAQYHERGVGDSGEPRSQSVCGRR
jgi:hypothetical protein